MAITNEHGDTTLVTSHNNEMMEWLARGITIRMGGSSLIAEYSMDGETAKRTSVPGTIASGSRSAAACARRGSGTTTPSRR